MNTVTVDKPGNISAKSDTLYLVACNGVSFTGVGVTGVVVDYRGNVMGDHNVFRDSPGGSVVVKNGVFDHLDYPLLFRNMGLAHAINISGRRTDRYCTFFERVQHARAEKIVITEGSVYETCVRAMDAGSIDVCICDLTNNLNPAKNTTARLHCGGTVTTWNNRSNGVWAYGAMAGMDGGQRWGITAFMPGEKAGGAIPLTLAERRRWLTMGQVASSTDDTFIGAISLGPGVVLTGLRGSVEGRVMATNVSGRVFNKVENAYPAVQYRLATDTPDMVMPVARGTWTDGKFTTIKNATMAIGGNGPLKLLGHGTLNGKPIR